MTTITPPFTGSYAATLQGINVSRFDLFGTSISPKLGRSGAATFLSSSNEIIDITTTTRAFFDDSLRKPVPVTAYSETSTASVEVISDDEFKVQELPQYNLSRQTFGIERNFDNVPGVITPFREMNDFNPIRYIEDPEQVAWPVVIDTPNALDPFDYDGAIEPLVIRKVVGGYSTFIGDIDDPEPTGIRGAVSSGELKLNRKGNKASRSNNFYSVKAYGGEVFEEVGLSPDFEIFSDSTFTIEIPFESSVVPPVSPFVDRKPPQNVFSKVTNVEIREALEEATTKINFENGYPGEDFKSSPCGYDYQNSRGIDSVSYGGLLR